MSFINSRFLSNLLFGFFALQQPVMTAFTWIWGMIRTVLRFLLGSYVESVFTRISDSLIALGEWAEDHVEYLRLLAHARLISMLDLASIFSPLFSIFTMFWAMFGAAIAVFGSVVASFLGSVNYVFRTIQSFYRFVFASTAVRLLMAIFTDGPLKLLEVVLGIIQVLLKTLYGVLQLVLYVTQGVLSLLRLDVFFPAFVKLASTTVSATGRVAGSVGSAVSAAQPVAAAAESEVAMAG
eukprot:Rmarinus@m.1031